MRRWLVILRSKRILVSVLLFGALASIFGALAFKTHASGSWATTGSLKTGRAYHTATLLDNGQVLVAGGRDSSGNSLASAELYTPGSGTWAFTGSMATARHYYTATKLSNSQVLVAGGLDSLLGTTLASAELYDPSSGSWSPTGSMTTTRNLATATLLANGMVLVAGGVDNFGTMLASAELYDPATGTWSSTGSMHFARQFHTATLLPNGKVLVTGGFGPTNYLASAELYDPATGSWSLTGSMAAPRYAFTATLLANGHVLVAGGANNQGPNFPNALATAEVYDPGSGTWSPTGSMSGPRYALTASLLPSGQVLAAGGYEIGTLQTAELYDPTAGTWSSISNMNFPRGFHTATVLSTGQVLVAGGYDPDSYIQSAELYPGTAPNASPTVSALPNATLTEGSTYAASGSFADPDSTSWTATVNYGDGAGPQALTLNPDKSFNLNHVYADNGLYTLTVTVTDDGGAAGMSSASVTVTNVPPTITGIAGPTQVLTSTSVSYTGTATDPSHADTTAGFTWNWSLDGVAVATGNPATLSFASCGTHTVSATATDKDGGVSAPASLPTAVSAYDGTWQPPLNYGQVNVAKAGSVIPVKVTVGCNGASLAGLSPAIQLISGDVDGTTDTGTNYVATISAAAADTTGVMRDAGSGYIYNLRVPSAPSGRQFTIRVRPFGDSDAADGMYILIQVK
jgi:N-acetylneuraminic acid mutarotase